MHELIIVKTGTTFAELKKQQGDFEDWICARLGEQSVNVHVCAVAQGERLPELQHSAGVIVTGSHAMVTDRPAWSEATASWLRTVVDAQVPLLAICYGHQLLAQALGGTVAYGATGPEMGTATARLCPAAQDDPLLGALPPRFATLNGHSQFVIQPPPEATILAVTARDACHAFRVGTRAWGVQFHPEFDAKITREYIAASRAQLRAGGQDPLALAAACVDTPDAAGLIARFAELALGTM